MGAAIAACVVVVLIMRVIRMGIGSRCSLRGLVHVVGVLMLFVMFGNLFEMYSRDELRTCWFGCPV